MSAGTESCAGSSCTTQPRGLLYHRNSKGYDVAMRWRAKFSHISPVWYQIRWNGTDFMLSGQHDVDAGWMARLKLPAEPVRSSGFCHGH